MPPAVGRRTPGHSFLAELCDHRLGSAWIRDLGKPNLIRPSQNTSIPSDVPC